MAQGQIIDAYPWSEAYRVSGTDAVLTPALVIYPEIVRSNIDATLKLLGGDAQRWRPHVKTSKLAFTMRLLVERGVVSFKCATTLELVTACQAGAQDVLVAYPVMGANAERVKVIAAEFPRVRVSALVEHESQIERWKGSRVGLFLDINPGMDRTGIEQSRGGEIVALVSAIAASGLEFRGLHYYDGQYGKLEEPQRTTAAHEGYRRLLEIVSEVERSGTHVPEVITAGTPTFPCSLSFPLFREASFIHRISPGTIVYCDATSLMQLPAGYGFRPAALVLARVVSRPRAGIITCDAGHKSVSVDAGVPSCVVLGHPELTPLSPSEEHLPIAVDAAAASPAVGEALFLLPRHVCPTVNNFDWALFVRNREIESVEKVSARGREAPLLQAAIHPLR